MTANPLERAVIEAARYLARSVTLDDFLDVPQKISSPLLALLREVRKLPDKGLDDDE